VCLCAVAPPVHAQPGAETPALTLTLDDALARGLAASHRLAEAIARGDAASAVAAQRAAAALPQVAAQGGYTRTNHVQPFGIPFSPNVVQLIYPDLPNNLRSRLDLQWPIYTGGRIDALERAAKAEASASVAEVDQARADLRLEITRAYWALVTAREAVRVVTESLNRTGAHVRDVRNQLEAGLVPPNDVFSAEAQEARQQMLSVQAALARDVAAADLARLVDVDPSREILPSSELEARARRREPLDPLLAEARRTRPERAALASRIAAAEERQRAAAAGRRPSVAIAAGVDYAKPNPRIFPRQDLWNESWDASVNVNWPLFDGGRTQADVAEASASLRAIRERLNEFDTVLSVEVRQRAAEVDASDAAVAAAGSGIRAATEALRVVTERFTAGVATSTDVLDAQVALLQAGLDRTQALANARLADARLDRAVGR
jgi:outer membrane protein TolC